MSLKSDIVEDNGQLFVEFEEARFALGLQVPKKKTACSLSTSLTVPLLDLREIKNITGSSEFSFGREWFDSSWITNQNGYGSCAGYGGTSGLEKAIVLGGQPETRLSGDYLYSRTNGGRDRGSMLDDNMEALMKHGVCKRETVKLGQIYRNDYDTQEADEEAKRFRGHELFQVRNEQEMATALVMKMPVVMAIHVTGKWRKFDAQDVLAPANGMGNHCEHLDDIRYNVKRSRLEFRKGTSHSKDYSPGGASEGSGAGYCWTYWEGHYKQTSKYHMFYAVPSAIWDPEADLPPLFDEDPEPGPDPEPTPEGKPILEVVSQRGCSACEQWKSREQDKVEQAGYRVKFVDSSVIPGRYVPRFRLTVGDKHKDLTPPGYKSLAEIDQVKQELTNG